MTGDGHPRRVQGKEGNQAWPRLSTSFFISSRDSGEEGKRLEKASVSSGPCLASRHQWTSKVSLDGKQPSPGP